MSILERPPWPVADPAALAALVAHPTDPHARAIDAENRNAGRLPGIAEAADSGTAYMVNVAPDVLALDVDTDPDDHAARRSAEALANAGRLMDAIRNATHGRCQLDGEEADAALLELGPPAVHPVESMALTVALAQVQRGEVPSPNVATVCVLALARLCGRDDWTESDRRMLEAMEAQPASPPPVVDLETDYRS